MTALGPFPNPSDAFDAADLDALERLDGALASDVESHGYQLTLEVHGSRAKLGLSGSLDLASADAVGGILSGPGQLPGAIELAFDGVSRVDHRGMELVVAAARERVQHGGREVRLIALSAPIAAALEGLGMKPVPPLALHHR
ncbi:MAG: hypothetical protein JWN95_3540 [Frankiales bacterium]|nr:hypothetical protein [Frankiales bacterium]